MGACESQQYVAEFDSDKWRSLRPWDDPMQGNIGAGPVPQRGDGVLSARAVADEAPSPGPALLGVAV